MATQSPTNPSYGQTFSPLRGDPALGSLVYPLLTVTTVTAGTTATLTAAQLLGGLILHDPTGAGTDTTDTAANIIAAMQGAAVGQGFYFDLVNIADGNETITVAAGTGVTLATYSPATGTYTVGQNNGKRFLCVITALANLSGTVAAAVTIYSLGTYVF
jgi:hypothetical protein